LTGVSFAKMAGDKVSPITQAGFIEASGLPP
jgi:hypothetical protein